jgi:hypothetical protein
LPAVQSILFLQSHAAQAEKLFEIGEKYFQHHKADFSDILRDFGECFAERLQHHDLSTVPEFAAYVGHFYTKVGEFFKTDDAPSRELVKPALTDKHGNIWLLAISTRMDSLTNLIQNSFDVDELKDKVMRVFIRNLDWNRYRRAMIVEDFDFFCAKVLNFPTIFQLVFRHCKQLEDILNMVCKYKVDSGYKLKSFNEDENATSCEKGSLCSSDELLTNVSQLLCFINRHEIPLEHLEEFLHNNLGQILSYTLVSGNDVIDMIFETLKLLNNSKKIVEMIKRGLDTIDESKKEEFRTFKDEHGRTIFEIIDIKASVLYDDLAIEHVEELMQVLQLV